MFCKDIVYFYKMSVISYNWCLGFVKTKYMISGNMSVNFCKLSFYIFCLSLLQMTCSLPQTKYDSRSMSSVTNRYFPFHMTTQVEEIVLN